MNFELRTWQYSTRHDDMVDTSMIVGNREGMLKHVELPMVDATDAYERIALAERIFCIGGYDEREKLEVVSVSFIVDVLSWFNSETHIRGFQSWLEFKEKFIVRFSKKNFRDPSQPFFAVKHA